MTTTLPVSITILFEYADAADSESLLQVVETLLPRVIAQTTTSTRITSFLCSHPVSHKTLICTMWHETHTVFVDDEYPGSCCWGTKAKQMIETTASNQPIGGNFCHLFWNY